MLKIQRTTDRDAIVLTVSGRLDAENVERTVRSCSTQSRAAGPSYWTSTDLVLADRDVVRLLRDFEACDRIVLRNCPAYIRIWMAAEDIL